MNQLYEKNRCSSIERWRRERKREMLRQRKRGKGRERKKGGKLGRKERLRGERGREEEIRKDFRVLLSGRYIYGTLWDTGTF